MTPEYNGAPPAVLKNAIDWISRPFGIGAILGKPVAVVGTSGGRLGGVWSHEYTGKIPRIAGAQVLEDVALLVPHAAERFATTHPADDGEVASALFDVLVTLAAAARATTEAPGAMMRTFCAPQIDTVPVMDHVKLLLEVKDNGSHDPLFDGHSIEKSRKETPCRATSATAQKDC